MSGGGMINPLITAAMMSGIISGSAAGLSLRDDKFTLYDPAAPTKVLRFDAGNITAGQTRVLSAPDADITLAGINLAQTWTAAQTLHAAAGLVVRQASTQDGIALVGRAGGSSSYEVTITPTTLTGDRTLTLPDASVILAGSASALTSGRIPVAAAGGLLSDSANSPTLSGANLSVVGSLSAASASVVTSGGLSQITVGASVAGGYSAVVMHANGTNRNWLFGSQYNVGGAFEITPSTANGGTTFTTPVVTLTPSAITLAQPVTCSSTLTAEGTINANSGTIQLNGKSFCGITGGNTFNFGAISNSGVRTLNFYTNNGSDVATLRGGFDANGHLSIVATTDGALTVAGKITAKVAVPGSFDDSSLANLAADIQSYLASILT